MLRTEVYGLVPYRRRRRAGLRADLRAGLRARDFACRSGVAARISEVDVDITPGID